MTVKMTSFPGRSRLRTIREEFVMTTPELSSTWMLLTEIRGVFSSLLCYEGRLLIIYTICKSTEQYV